VFHLSDVCRGRVDPGESREAGEVELATSRSIQEPAGIFTPCVDGPSRQECLRLRTVRSTTYCPKISYVFVIRPCGGWLVPTPGEQSRRRCYSEGPNRADYYASTMARERLATRVDKDRRRVTPGILNGEEVLVCAEKPKRTSLSNRGEKGVRVVRTPDSLTGGSHCDQQRERAGRKTVPPYCAHRA